MAEQQEVNPQSPPTIDGVLNDAAPKQETSATAEAEGAQTLDEDQESPPVDPRDAEIADLQTQLAEQVEMVTNIKRQHSEAIVEFNNARTRLKRDVGREVQNSLKSLLGELLETLDNLDRAIDTAAGRTEESDLLHGVVMVRDQFLAKLGNFQVTRVPSLDAEFNPNFHEAISMVPVQDPAQDGKVISVIKEGYTMHGEVLRAAVVAVGKCDVTPEAPSDEKAPETTEE